MVLYKFGMCILYKIILHTLENMIVLLNTFTCVREATGEVDFVNKDADTCLTVETGIS